MIKTHAVDLPFPYYICMVWGLWERFESRLLFFYLFGRTGFQTCGSLSLLLIFIYFYYYYYFFFLGGGGGGGRRGHSGSKCESDFVNSDYRLGSPEKGL